MNPETTPVAERSDAELVAESLGGRADAFRAIVARYQNLVCAIAYSETGSVGRSEDVAQETFVAAWTQLRSLREPEKLRRWLCGIVRNRLRHLQRDDRREPVQAAAPLEEVAERPSPEPAPSEQAIRREQEAMLWSALEKIPPLYREPLVLFYREQRSIGQVAAALELSEETVRQRLSRGRSLLQTEVQAMVESTLARTAPNPAFAAAVLQALPAAGGASVATGFGAATKGTAVAAKTGTLGGVALLLAPFLGIAAGVAAHWFVVREHTADRRRRARRLALLVVGWALYLALAVGGEALVQRLGRRFQWSDSVRFAAQLGFWWAFVSATVTAQIVVARRRLARAATGPRPAGAGQRPLTTMRAPALAAVSTGVHLALFSWLVALAWRLGDSLGAGLALAAMVALGLVAFLRIRRATMADAARVLVGHFVWVGAILLLLVNLRSADWVAASHGVSRAQAGALLPVWLVPAFTAAFVAWTVCVVVATRPRRGSTPVPH